MRAQQICGTIFEHFCTTGPVVEWAIDIPEAKKTTRAKGEKVSYLKSYESDTIHCNPTFTSRVLLD